MNHRNPYPFHGMRSDTSDTQRRVQAALDRLDRRIAEEARRERNARRAVYGIFAAIGLAVAVRIAYAADLHIFP